LRREGRGDGVSLRPWVDDAQSFQIGEYLATGIPVVTTKVGEIEKFITDGQTGFLAIPGSVESFYLKMKEALTDYEKSKQIGRNGKKIAEQFFDYKVQADKMAHFINQL
jgi:glycosyltransferase involved in cell wall biosynthesis